MAVVDDDAATDEAPGMLDRWRALPVAVQITLIYLVSRLVTLVFFQAAAELSSVGSRYGAHANVGTLAMGWDAQWYWYVAFYGYPGHLPLRPTGEVAENPWAFLPVYPWLSQALGAPFGSWGVGAVIISLLAGLGACLMLYLLLRTRLPYGVAMTAVVFFANSPLAGLFQVAYAESLALFLLFLSLWALVTRRFWILYLTIPLMGFTRPGVLAFALALGLYGIRRWFRRARDPLPARQIVHIVALGALSVVVGFAWQLIAGWATGRPDAYMETELAWRRNWLSSPEHGFVPFEGWVSAGKMWFGIWGLDPIAGWILVALGTLAVAWFLFSRPVRRLGPEIHFWALSYTLYLLLVFFPQSSIFRLLVPLSPLWGALALPRSKWARGGILILCLVGQWWWIYNMYGLGNRFWQVP